MITTAQPTPPSPGEERYGEIANTLRRLRRVWMANPSKNLADIVSPMFDGSLSYHDSFKEDKDLIQKVERYYKEDELG